jgi:hypothetical protein
MPIPLGWALSGVNQFLVPELLERMGLFLPLAVNWIRFDFEAGFIDEPAELRP